MCAIMQKLRMNPGSVEAGCSAVVALGLNVRLS